MVRVLFRAMESGDPVLSRRVVADDHINHMAADEPPACAEPGPGGFLATSAWLRSAFAELRFEELDVAVNGDQVFCRMRMRGVHTGPFVVFPPGRPAEVFPATGVRFTAEQVHIFRVRDGVTTEHRAVRDGLGMVSQLGFIPPRPAVALRLLAMHISGRARRAIRAATDVAAEAAHAARAGRVMTMADDWQASWIVRGGSYDGRQGRTVGPGILDEIYGGGAAASAPAGDSTSPSVQTLASTSSAVWAGDWSEESSHSPIRGVSLRKWASSSAALSSPGL